MIEHFGYLPCSLLRVLVANGILLVSINAGIRMIYLRELNKGFGLKFLERYRQRYTPERGHRVQ